jgi:uracil-DNA glycosylase
MLDQLLKQQAHPSWLPLLESAIQALDPDFVGHLNNSEYLPGADKLFAAFARPMQTAQYILYGESPYPRPESANGRAFWDAAVTDLWSENGLSKSVNRATSLRNLIKMLLVAEGLLDEADTGQPAIARLDKTGMVQTADQFFTGMLDKGFVLLNASLSLSGNLTVPFEARQWLPFQKVFLEGIAAQRPDMTLVLWGKIAEKLDQIEAARHLPRITAMHPYNLAFIKDKGQQDFFRHFELLRTDNE